VADEKVEVDADGWGERDDRSDWAAPLPPAQPPPPARRRSHLFLVAGLLLFTALMATLVLRRANVAQERAEEEAEAALDGRVQMANAKVRAARPKANPAPDPGPKLDPAEAERLMAADAAALNRLGVFRLDNTGDIDGAVAALQEAAKLDPQYVANLDRALRRKAEVAMKEQAERDRAKAAAAVGGGPVIAVTPEP
jgi:tetratricopeptide (TPR) repeat protein